MNVRRTQANENEKSQLRVFIIDQDPVAAESIAEVARAHHLLTEYYESGEEFLSRIDGDQPGCAVVELDLPGISGFQLLDRLTATERLVPVLMVAAKADVGMAVRAMKRGAVDFLQKPVHPLELWESMHTALERDRHRREQEQSRTIIEHRIAQLTKDEFRVMQLVLEGRQNKAIAAMLDLSVRSIDFRRASILRKMQVRSLIELAQMLGHIHYQVQTPNKSTMELMSSS